MYQGATESILCTESQDHQPAANVKNSAFLQENKNGTQENLSRLLDSTKQDMNQRLSDLKSVQDELRTTNLLIRNTGQYLANKSVY